jgi:phage terminase large subunit-like protein
MTLALVDELRRWPEDDIKALLTALSPEEAAALWWEWSTLWARPDQLAPPAFWIYWWLFGGKGSGKTRAAAEWVNARAAAGFGPVRLIAGTDDDVRDTLIEGVSGILASARPDFVPEWEPSKKRLTWPNGVKGLCFSAEEPKRLHGKAGQTDWYDDLTGWKSRAKETFDVAAFGLREGDARAVLTANPEESELIVSLFDDPSRQIVRVESTTDDNLVNLAPALLSTLRQFAGTEIELRHRHGVLVRSSAGNPFRGINFEDLPVRAHEAGELEEIALVLDPADGCTTQHDEWGIGCIGRRSDRHVVGLEDASARLEEDAAGETALDILDRWAFLHPSARLVIVAETNRGEKRIRSTINAAHWRRVAEGRSRRPLPEIVGVVAKDAKGIRAGELRGLYLGGLLHHLVGMAPCEAQQRTWNPAAPRRPAVDDRIDWLTHGVHYLAGLGGAGIPAPWAPAAGAPFVAGRYAGVDPRRHEPVLRFPGSRMAQRRAGYG